MKQTRKFTKQLIPNEKALEFLSGNIPLFECPDKQLEQTYYFRWWTYRKHLKQTPAGYIVTEFLPDVPGRANIIPLTARQVIIFTKAGGYGTPLFETVRPLLVQERRKPPGLLLLGCGCDTCSLTQVHPDTAFLVDLLPGPGQRLPGMGKMRLDSTGLFWQTDNRDGMEISVSGAYGQKDQGYRATINSYMFGNAKALSDIAGMAGNQKLENEYRQKAIYIRRQILNKLWDDQAYFFKVIPRGLPALKRSRRP